MAPCQSLTHSDAGPEERERQRGTKVGGSGCRDRSRDGGRKKVEKKEDEGKTGRRDCKEELERRGWEAER